MKPVFHKILNILSGRVALNILFWAFIILPRMDTDEPGWVTMYACVLYFLLIVPVYLNNLFLIDRLAFVNTPVPTSLIPQSLSSKSKTATFVGPLPMSQSVTTLKKK